METGNIIIKAHTYPFACQHWYKAIDWIFLLPSHCFLAWKVGSKWSGWYPARCWVEIFKIPRNSLQCDTIRWEQFENWHFSRCYNFWTDDLILILKTPTRPNLCPAKVIVCSEFVKTCCSKVVGSWKVPIFELFRSDYITVYYKARSVQIRRR